MQKAIPVFKKHSQEFLGAILIFIAAIFFFSILGFSATDYYSLLKSEPVKNMLGPVGAWIAYLLRSLFGGASYILIPSLVVAGTYIINNESVRKPTEKSLVLLLLTISASAMASRIFQDIPEFSGGLAGQYISEFFASHFGSTASYFIILGINFVGAVLLLTFILFSDRRNKSEISDIFRPMVDLKIPWITKKKIIIYEAEARQTLAKSPLLSDLKELASMNENMLLTENLYAGHIRALEPPSLKDSLDEDVDSGIQGEGVASKYVEAQNVEYTIDNDLYQDNDFDTTQEAKTQDIGEDESGIKEGEAPDAKDKAEIISAFSEDIVGTADPAEHVFDKISINEEYIIPTSFLTSSKPLDSEGWKNEIRRNSALLIKMLAEFGIESEVVNVNRGPVITLYEMQIAPGIKVNRIVSLADDIAMALAAHRVRIVAPIPGKSAIGVEIPNRFRETVTLGDIVKSDEFQTFEGSLVVGLGKDILGKPVMLDLKRLPHLLIAGATGSGKSVCVNSIITSLVYNYDPNYVRFILIDPKMVELQLYNGLPHLLTPVIVDPMMAPVVLKWTLHEMERRYCLLSEMNTRDIERYNDKIARYDGSIEKLPYIVTIIDEMADLIMTSKEVEGYITRIAQKARAVGIHLVVATQRPSVDIITGIIKANFPARIAFQVAQKTDSRTIIDQNGAEKLLGRGDMLYQSPTSSFPIRIQGGFISEEEVERIASHLRKLGKASYIDLEQSLFDEEAADEQDQASDDLFQEALKIVEETRKASASYLQRRLSIGYNRAARIIEKMEEKGYIGPQIGSKPREVLI